MLKQLLFKNILGLGLVIFSCSFIVIRGFDKNDNARNQIELNGEVMTLSFGGLEEIGISNWFNIPTAEHFKTSIYLSDVHLNDATSNTSEKVVIQFDNYMSGTEFKSGAYNVVPGNHRIRLSSESLVIAKLLRLEGKDKIPSIIGGTVEYTGTYPEIEIDFNLVLSNGQRLQGSFDKYLEDFKYSF